MEKKDKILISIILSGPEVVWDRSNNPYPWQNIGQDTQVKLMTVNQKFDKM